MPPNRCTYLCPVHFNATNEALISGYNQYWKFLKEEGCEIIVVDGSPPPIFDIHEKEWTYCRHLKIDKHFRYLNGKVNGIMTGLKEASHDKIILADDDIYFIAEDVARMVKSLEKYAVVRPQNYFKPLPWWSRIDAARILINRAVLPEGDYPGTLGFHKSIFEAAGPFDGNVLFDNEELVKHLQNYGASISFSTDFFILRRPPLLNKWFEQRPRQAYEDFVMKEKTILFLSLLPVSLLLGMTGKRKALGMMSLLLSVGVVGLALLGRKGKADRFFPAYTSLYAPLWMLERSISVYIALYWRFCKGGYPFGGVLVRKGTGEAWKAFRKQRQKRKS